MVLKIVKKTFRRQVNLKYVERLHGNGPTRRLGGIGWLRMVNKRIWGIEVIHQTPRLVISSMVASQLVIRRKGRYLWRLRAAGSVAAMKI